MNASSFLGMARSLIGLKGLLVLGLLGCSGPPAREIPQMPWGERHQLSCDDVSRCMLQAGDLCRGDFEVLETQYSKELVGRDPLERKIVTGLEVRCKTPVARRTRQLQVAEEMRNARD